MCHVGEKIGVVQFAPLALRLDGSWARASGARGGGLLVRAFSTAPLAAEIREGWVSPDYGQRARAPALVCRAAARLPLRIVTLLVPAADALAAPPEVAASLDEGRIVLAFAGTRETLRIEEHDIVVCAESPAS